LPEITSVKNSVTFKLPPGAVYCLSPVEKPLGFSGEEYRRARAQSALAVQSLNAILPAEKFANFDWKFLADQIESSPFQFLAAASRMAGGESQAEFSDLIQKAGRGEIFPAVVSWTLIDRRRVTLVPANHWLLVEDSAPFQAVLHLENAGTLYATAIPAGKNYIAVFAPRETPVDAELILERHAAAAQTISGAIRFLPTEAESPTIACQPSDMILLTNGIGGMARLCVDFGAIKSKYDCLLGANLNPRLPVDRHVFAKRARVWVNADGFLISPLICITWFRSHLARPPPGVSSPMPATAGPWKFKSPPNMLPEPQHHRAVSFQPARTRHRKQAIANDCDVRLTVRVDIEDRNFHQ
jgi:starch synthase (maltosyl-transferring)